jgi:ATPase subunit of ABC transporter with duplicated ATPase domains
MARLASRVVEVDHGRVRLYPGGYDDYESSRLARNDAAPAPVKVRVAEAAENRPRVKGGRVVPGDAAKDRPSSRDAQRRAQNAQKSRERETARIESDIERRESRMRELETALADPGLYHDATRSKDLVHEYERLRAETEALWQRLGELG